MADIKDVVFRSSFTGYNKEDVNEYIIRTSSDFTAREEALKARTLLAEEEVQKSTEKLSDLSKQLTELESEIDALSSELRALRNENATLKEEQQEETLSEAKAAEYETRLAEQESVIAKQFEEIDTLKEENEKLKAEKESAEAAVMRSDELARKAQLYDKTSANIGDAIISAKKTAEEIVFAAKEEAQGIVEKANKELEERRRILEESSVRAYSSVFSKIVAAASENKKEVAALSSYSTQLLEKTLSELKSKNDSAAVRIKTYEESLWRSIKDDLNSIRNTPEHRDGIPAKPSSDQAKRQKK